MMSLRGMHLAEFWCNFGLNGSRTRLHKWPESHVIIFWLQIEHYLLKYTEKRELFEKWLLKKLKSSELELNVSSDVSRANLWFVAGTFRESAKRLTTTALALFTKLISPQHFHVVNVYLGSQGHIYDLCQQSMRLLCVPTRNLALLHTLQLQMFISVELILLLDCLYFKENSYSLFLRRKKASSFRSEFAILLTSG